LDIPLHFLFLLLSTLRVQCNVALYDYEKITYLSFHDGLAIVL
jgi:hypothetical protein